MDRVQARGQAIGIKEGEERAKKQDALGIRDSLGITDAAAVAKALNLPTELVEHWFAEESSI